MDVLIVLVGQCGCSLGAEFFTQLQQNDKLSLFKNTDGYVRCVAVDSERKVVNSLKRSIFREDNVVHGKTGRGGVFAHGYYDDGSELLERAMECIRKEAELNWRLSGFIVVHSVSGGTGSGLGARILSELREEYARHFVCSVAVTPFVHGESSLQDYNTVLCISELQKSCDMVMMFHNDAIAELVRSSSPSSFGLSTINSYISEALRGALLPAQVADHPSFGTNLWDITASVCPGPSWKLLDCIFTKTPRAQGLSGMLNTFPNAAKTPMDQVLSAMLTLRGFSDSETKLVPVARDRLVTAFSFVSWNTFPVDIRFDRSKSSRTGTFAKPMASRNKSSTSSMVATTTLLWNRMKHVKPVQEALNKAWDKFEIKAFWHWYAARGMEEAEFQEAADNVHRIVADYANLRKS
eukprot:m.205915 g.205915  ORF g.205915 m.205915 type:complete len:408 (-) comp15793_c0_seq1:1183-2406(-)